VAKRPSINRRNFLGVAVGTVAVAAVGCGDDGSKEASSAGGSGTGGAGTGGAGTGGAATGGAGTGGAATGGAGTGGASTGGASTGGAGTGGATTGGATTGGATTGGATTGGASTGGASTGGASTGGATTGGASTGGATTGGADTGGATTGGADTGGTNTGGDATGGMVTGGTNTGGEAGGGTSTGGAGGSGPGELGYVTLVRAEDWKQATMDAVLARLPDLTGKSVMIRPNVIEARPDGTTNPEVIAGVVAACKQKGASSIVVGEDAFTGDAVPFMETLGITAAIGSDATTMNLSGTPTTNVRPANATAWDDANGIDVYDAVADADYVINVPRCKTHGIAGFSMALKAWFGSVRRPSSLHTNIQNKCAEAHLARQEDLVVLDATRCMTSGGPTQGGNMADSRLVVVTEDAIAADVTGVAIIRANGGSLGAPWTQNQIRRALQLQFRGWLTEQTDFTYSCAGISEADAAEIMARRSA